MNGDLRRAVATEALALRTPDRAAERETESAHWFARTGARFALEVVERQIVQQIVEQHEQMRTYLDKRDPTYADVARANVCNRISSELMRTLTTVIETRSTL